MNKKSFVYVVKPEFDSWFVGNTFAILIDDYRPEINSGLFLGTVQCLDSKSMGHNYGEIYQDEEICDFDEFENDPIGKIEFDYNSYTNKNEVL